MGKKLALDVNSDIENVVIQDVPQNIKDFLALPEGIRKNFLFTRLTKDFTVINAGKNEDRVYFSSASMKICKNGYKYYLKTTSKNGLSFKENKLNLWFGSKIHEIQFMEKLFGFMNWNFIEPSFYGYITKSSLEKIFKGKITNTRELLAHYIKSVRIKCSTELLYKACKLEMIHKSNFYHYCLIAKEPDNYLKAWINEKTNKPEFGQEYFDHNLSDLSNQYQTLDKKIDFTWSKKRLLEEHLKATDALTELEIEFVEDFDLDYPKIDLPPEMELLSNQKRVFAEGKRMRHCIYTNYWHSIKQKNYVAFHISLDGEEATLGCNFDNNKLKLNQVYQRGNQPVSEKMRLFCNDWISKNDEVFNIYRKRLNYNEPTQYVQQPAVIQAQHNDVFDFAFL